MQVLKSAPFGLQMIYLANCYVNLLNCFRIVRIRLRRDWLFLRVELRRGEDHLPKTSSFAVINMTITVTFAVECPQQVVFYIIVSDLQQERTWSSSTPPLIIHDIIYLLQIISSSRSPDTLNSMTLIVSAYVGELICNLPWRLIAFKGMVKLAELILFDLLEYPSIKVVTFVRDDLVMVVSYIAYFYYVDNVAASHTEETQATHAVLHGERQTAAATAVNCELAQSSCSDRISR